MSAKLDREVMEQLVQMHRELLLRESAAEKNAEARTFTADGLETGFDDGEFFQPRRLSLRVF